MRTYKKIYDYELYFPMVSGAEYSTCNYKTFQFNKHKSEAVQLWIF